jgi:glutathione S-transferase
MSPFGRKVKIAAHLLGLAGDIRVEAADTQNSNDTLRAQNPLGKIPVLVTEDGTSIFDSRVIVEYLDLRAGGGCVIPTGAGRFPALTRQALADGIMDASVLLRYETAMRVERERSPKWIDHQQSKIARGLAYLEANPPAQDDTTIGGIATACALGYLDIRFGGAWRASHPHLVAWLDRWERTVPAFDATRPPLQ